MNKIVLCLENGNPYVEETKKYLCAHDCKVYILNNNVQDIQALLEEIERNEGLLDILLMGVDRQIPRDGAIGEKHDCELLLKILSGQINKIQNAIEASLPPAAQRKTETYRNDY